MHEITLIVTLQVDSDGVLTEEQSKDAAVEAVKFALDFAESNGFSHRYADIASVGVADITAG